MSRALILVALLLRPAFAFAEAPADAPLAPAVVKKGDVVPFDGVLDTEAAFIKTEKHIAGLEAKVHSYEKAPPVPLSVVVIAAVALVAGAAAGAGVTYAVLRK